MSNIPKGVKGEYAIARSLCLYGNGDGKPIASADKLAELSGLSVRTIRNYIAGWLQEREEIAANSTKSTLALSLSAKELQLHKQDIEVLRSSLNRVAWEIKQHEKIVAKLEGICENFSLNTDNGAEALQVFDTYLRACGNRAALEKHFMQLQKQWTSLVGVDALQDVALTRAKADATLAAKMEAKKAENQEGVRDITPAGLQVFQRNS